VLLLGVFTNERGASYHDVPTISNVSQATGAKTKRHPEQLAAGVNLEVMLWPGSFVSQRCIAADLGMHAGQDMQESTVTASSQYADSREGANLPQPMSSHECAFHACQALVPLGKLGFQLLNLLLHQLTVQLQTRSSCSVPQLLQRLSYLSVTCCCQPAQIVILLSPLHSLAHAHWPWIGRLASIAVALRISMIVLNGPPHLLQFVHS
jgi:hypothetical protein